MCQQLSPYNIGDESLTMTEYYMEAAKMPLRFGNGLLLPHVEDGETELFTQPPTVGLKGVSHRFGPGDKKAEVVWHAVGKQLKDYGALLDAIKGNTLRDELDYAY